MLALHLHNEPALCLVRLVLNADIATLDGSLAPTYIVCPAFEH